MATSQLSQNFSKKIFVKTGESRAKPAIYQDYFEARSVTKMENIQKVMKTTVGIVNCVAHLRKFDYS